jgi:hypothetical protein
MKADPLDVNCHLWLQTLEETAGAQHLLHKQLDKICYPRWLCPVATIFHSEKQPTIILFPIKQQLGCTYLEGKKRLEFGRTEIFLHTAMVLT